jgi:hypothetical protein
MHDRDYMSSRRKVVGVGLSGAMIGLAGCTDRINITTPSENNETSSSSGDSDRGDQGNSAEEENEQSNEEIEVNPDLITVEDASIIERNLEVGDNIYIRVQIKNENQIEVDYQLNSTVGGTTVDIRSVTIGANTTKEFNIQAILSEQDFREGEYDVAVNESLVGDITVEDTVELIARLGSAPDPSGGTVQVEETSDGLLEYFVPIENQGANGEIDYALFWVEDENEEQNGTNTQYVETQSEYFENSESKTVSIVAGNPPPGYWGYNMKWATGALVTNIRNDGGNGRFEATLIAQTDSGQKVIIEQIEREISGYSSTSIQWNPELRQIDSEGISDFIFTTEVNPL